MNTPPVLKERVERIPIQDVPCGGLIRKSSGLYLRVSWNYANGIRALRYEGESVTHVSHPNLFVNISTGESCGYTNAHGSVDYLPDAKVVIPRVPVEDES